MKNKTRAIIASAVAAIAFVIGPTAANADVCPSCNGGLVANMSSSSNKILLYNGVNTFLLPIGHVSEWYTNYRDVDAFKLPWCAGQRYENGQWTTVYQAGVWYYIGDSANLSIRQAFC